MASVQTYLVTPTDAAAADRFRMAVQAAASAELGYELPVGTSVVGAAGRKGSTSVVAYPMGDRTVIWCAPDVAPRLASLEGQPALSNDEFVKAATELGGIQGGWGRFRVLDGMPPAPGLDPSQIRALDRDNAADCAFIADFITTCSANDLDEAELDIDELDPVILALLDASGAAAAMVYAMPWMFDADFDDIGIITRPDCRGRGSGAAAVAHFARQQQRLGRLPLYGCDTTNIGSDRLAESVGFTLVQTVASVRFA